MLLDEEQFSPLCYRRMASPVEYTLTLHLAETNKEWTKERKEQDFDFHFPPRIITIRNSSPIVPLGRAAMAAAATDAAFLLLFSLCSSKKKIPQLCFMRGEQPTNIIEAQVVHQKEDRSITWWQVASFLIGSFLSFATPASLLPTPNTGR